MTPFILSKHDCKIIVSALQSLYEVETAYATHFDEELPEEASTASNIAHILKRVDVPYVEVLPEGSYEH